MIWFNQPRRVQISAVSNAQRQLTRRGLKRALLLPSQRNQVFEEVRKNNLDPSEFYWRETKKDRIPTVAAAGVISVLEHKPTGYAFSFDVRNEHFFVQFSPSSESPEKNAMCNSWEEMLEWVSCWLQNLKRESSAPDVWQELAQGRVLLQAFEKSQEPFTEAERSSLHTALADIHRQIADQNRLSASESQFLKAKLEYLADGLDRMPREDWTHTAVGVFFTIAVGLALAPEQARSLFHLVVKALAPVIQAVKML